MKLDGACLTIQLSSCIVIVHYVLTWCIGTKSLNKWFLVSRYFIHHISWSLKCVSLISTRNFLRAKWLECILASLSLSIYMHMYVCIHACPYICILKNGLYLNILYKKSLLIFSPKLNNILLMIFQFSNMYVCSCYILLRNPLRSISSWNLKANNLVICKRSVLLVICHFN